MYHGNKPAMRGHERVSGGFNDRWVTRWGDGETFDDEVEFFCFNLNSKVVIFICDDTLWITDFRHNTPDVWDWCNNGKLKHLTRFRHDLEPERIEKYLSAKIPDCKIWDMVQKRAWELYSSAN